MTDADCVCCKGLIDLNHSNSLDLLVDGCLTSVLVVDACKGLHLSVGLVNNSQLALDLRQPNTHKHTVCASTQKTIALCWHASNLARLLLISWTLLDDSAPHTQTAVGQHGAKAYSVVQRIVVGHMYTCVKGLPAPMLLLLDHQRQHDSLPAHL